MTTLHPRNHQDGGLQAERTALAWTRTSLGVLANGALLMLKGFHGYTGWVRIVAVALALTLALSTYLIGTRRQRTLGCHPLPQRITPRREVYLLGTSVLVLVVISAVALPV
jgi:uncharacterized membrane protein YidH (DUF202 family)